MSDHTHLTRLREAYTAFDKGDLAALREFWHEDLRWHEPGSSPVAGDYQGPDAVFGMFGQVMEMTENSLRAEVVLTCADDENGTALVHFTAHRGDRHLDTRCAHVTRFDADGRAVEFWNAPLEPVVWDAFWS